MRPFINCTPYIGPCAAMIAHLSSLAMFCRYGTISPSAPLLCLVPVGLH